ncbi:MAG: 6-phosphogluconolactonase [Cyanobacteria bacterium J06598_3]
MKVDDLTVQIYESAAAVALAASAFARQTLSAAIEQKQQARAIFATGRSQIQFLQHLSDPATGLDWQKVTGFHLDEYLGLAADHPASFRHYLHQHLTSKVSLKQWHDIVGDGLLPLEICQGYEKRLRERPIDLCCLGIGNNGHLAFNDPAVARFDDAHWVKIVRLDESNRQQQVDSSAFETLNAVPQYAFTLTLSALHSTRQNLCLAYGAGKAKVIDKTLTGDIGAHCPSSILRQMPQAILLIDRAAARLIG